MYKADKDDVYLIEHYGRNIGDCAELLTQVCSQKKDQILLGFELGGLFSDLKNIQLGIYELLEKIKSQPSTPIGWTDTRDSIK